jgi:hypothetical protein
VHFIIEYSSFKTVYGFNPLTLLYFINLPVDKRVSLDGNQKAQMIKDLHAKMQQQIEKKNEQYEFKANKECKLVRFEPKD